MAKFIAKRILATVIILFVTSIFIFVITNMMPGDAIDLMLGGLSLQSVGQETVAQLRAQLGLDLPLYQQYLHWLVALLQGDLGTSYIFNAPIAPIISERIYNSLLLAVPAIMIMIVVGLVSGVVSAINEGKKIDHSISFLGILMLSIPEFLIGTVFIYIFAVQLNWIPAAFNTIDTDSMSVWQSMTTYFKVLIFPSLTIAFGSIAYVSRQTRASMIEELKSNYVRTALLKGVPYKRVVWVHALKNGLLPTVTVIAFNIGQIIAGTVIVEVVFSYPGIGNLIIMALNQRDIPLILATMMIISLIYVISNLAADILYSRLNPKISYS
ncbi:ABC transporter permease [Psychromonas hadalis]|uniref:ABC transporter permease n=1 Tax=Psychromonas hadalis TaxID=211669 RepID=UPI0012EB913A|nr:ABC transporter permease [Psychromonas hadalis]